MGREKEMLNFKEHCFLTSQCHYNAVKEFITSGLANELKGKCLLCLRLADSNKNLWVLCGDASDVEWPCQGLTTLQKNRNNAEYTPCYGLMNVKLINNLV